MTYTDISADSSIQDKISWANECYKKNKETFLRDKKLKALLESFHKAASQSLKEMSEIGIVSECRKCEEEDGGTCCGAGIENRYSGTLLLINLILGAKLQHKRIDSQGCYFLGGQGCSLRARHVICVNYICQKITDTIPHQMIQQLRENEGTELETLFLFNERIKTILRELK